MKYLSIVVAILLSSTVAAQETINLNGVFRHLADEQGVEPGSPNWTKGGIMAYSGQGGGHPSYGWEHDFKLSKYPDYAKWAIANYGHRGAYYARSDNKVIGRNGGYLSGSRPFGYVPELPGDQPKGEVFYITSTGISSVSGPDALHFQINPLFALYDSGQNIPVKAQWKTVSASLVAGVEIRYLMKAMAGMTLTKEGKMSTYSWGDRGSSLFMMNTTRAIVRGLVDAPDAAALATYIEKTTVPSFEKAPGFHNQQKDNPIPGMLSFQLYNGLFWLLPPFYDAWKAAPEGVLKERLGAIVKRWSQYMLDLEEAVPGNGTNVASVNFGPEFPLTGAPVPSWKPYLKPEWIHKGKTDWSLWGLRAQHTAAKVLGSSVLMEASKKTVQKHIAKKNTDDRVWFFGADMEELG